MNTSASKIGVFAIAAAWSITTTAIADDPLPIGIGGVRLPVGYRHQRNQMSIDTAGGRIWKPGGLEIRYAYGGGDIRVEMFDPQIFRWKNEFEFGRNTVAVAITKDDEMTVSFIDKRGPWGLCDFFGKVKTPEDVAEFMLIALSYALPPPSTQPATQPSQGR